jgi:hypothetical protein
LRWAVDGPAYVPFIGDGDIAMGGNRSQEVLKHELYRFPGLYANRFIYGADLDKARVEAAQLRVTCGLVRVADCNQWPFYDLDTEPFAVADFDAWDEPYPSFRSFWKYATKADRMVLFFTDAHRMGIMVDGTFIHPDGSKHTIANLTERRQAFNFYLAQHVWPWFDEFVKPYRVLDRFRYLRGMLTYWGAAVERKPQRVRKRAPKKLSEKDLQNASAETPAKMSAPSA